MKTISVTVLPTCDGRGLLVVHRERVGKYIVRKRDGEIDHEAGPDVLGGLASLARDRVLSVAEKVHADGTPRVVDHVRTKR